MTTINLEQLSSTIKGDVAEIVEAIGRDTESRAYKASNELTNATAYVLRGQRSGKKYNIPGVGRMVYNKKSKTARIVHKKYTASAPGEAPAVRTGLFRMGWKRRTYISRLDGSNRVLRAVTENDQMVGKYLLGELLEEGTGKMAPRPYKDKVIQMALPRIIKIYKEPYHRG